MASKLDQEIEGVEREIEKVELEIKNAEREIEDAESRIRMEKDHEQQRQLREDEQWFREEKEALCKEKNSLRKKEYWLREEKRDELRQLRKLGKYEWTDQEVLDELARSFFEKAKRARSSEMEPVENDLGQEFVILGREKTFAVLFEGTCNMHHNFITPACSLEDYKRGKEFIFGMVAFPGAGKTTLGTRARPLVAEQWRRFLSRQNDSVDSSSSVASSSLSGLNRPGLTIHPRFQKMCEASLQYNLCLYHSVDTVEGGLLREEMGLGREQVLALRTLAAILDERDYVLFLNDLNYECPGLKYVLTFEIILRFLRLVVEGIAADRKVDGELGELMFTIFFDEVNGVKKNLKGETVVVDGMLVENNPTWFQSIMSTYIDCHWNAARKFGELKLFPVLSVASTKFYAVDLQFTESAQTETVLVPFYPLSHEQSVTVVRQLLENWAIELKLGTSGSITLSQTTEYLITLAGGMPRALSRAIESLVRFFSRGNDDCMNDIIQRSIQHISPQDLEFCVQRMTHRLNFEKYLEDDGHKKEMLLRVLCRCINATPVKRSESVLENLECKFWELETAGLVALTPYRSKQTLAGQEQDLLDFKARKVDDRWVTIKCSPFILKSLMQSSHIPVEMPCLESGDWRLKEREDISSIMLRMYLLEASLGRTTFKLEEILPPGVIIPQPLKDKLFRLHTKARGIHQIYTCRKQANFANLDSSSIDSAVFLLPGNEGPDSCIFLLVQGTLVSPFVFIIQSKQTTQDDVEAFSPLFDNYFRDLTDFGIRIYIGKSTSPATGEQIKEFATRLNEGSHNEQLFYKLPAGMQDFVFVYCTNRRISNTFHEKMLVETAEGKACSKIIYAAECVSAAYGDPVTMFSAMRRIKRQLYDEKPAAKKAKMRVSNVFSL